MTTSRFYPRLLGDVGGTHARFALQAEPGAALEALRVLACGDYAGIDAAIRDYLRQTGIAMPPYMGLGIANPITGDRIRMTNHSWEFSIEELRRTFGLRKLAVVNDFTALALALPLLAEHELRQIGGGSGVDSAPCALIGPGTGLGVSGLIPVRGRRLWQRVALVGEGGHASLAAQNATEAQIIEVLRRRYAHVSAERVVSGPGLVDLYYALAEVGGQAPQELRTAPEVARQAFDAGDALALATLETFCGFLGSIAGDLALTLGARGGVYIGGGIVPRWGAWFDRSSFRRRFEAKGRFADYLRVIPVRVIQAQTPPALLGAGQALDLEH